MVIEGKRPVPLHFFYHCQNEIVDKIERMRKTYGARPNKLTFLINHIRQKEGLPCIYFVFGRRKAEELAFELQAYNFLERDEKTQITRLFQDLCIRFGLENDFSAQRMSPLISNGIAYHHAGMLPTLKEVVERLFTSRLLKVIFTTETFALGINMPSRSVIFDELRKYYGRYVRTLKTRDFYQMAGRAGRRGIDNEGFVYSRINLHRINPQEIKRIIYGQPEEVKSQLNTSYATILNLYEEHKDNLYKVYPLSLHYFQSSKHTRREALRLLEAKIKLLKEYGYIRNNALTAKGQFAKSVYGYELILSELYAQNILEQLDEFELGIIACAVVFEPRKNQHLTTLSKTNRRIKTTCEQIFAEIKQGEERYRVYPFSKSAYFHLSAAIEAWLRGTEFAKILRLTDTDEGEVVRYFRMAVQILREINEAKVASHILKEKIRETIRVINRDVVDAEKQLREG